MNANVESQAPSRSEQLDALVRILDGLVDAARDNPREILALLRMLEQLHRDICENHFQKLLPNNRHDLYDLLTEIEAQGGWPYIERMKLRSLTARLEEGEIENSSGAKP